VDGLERHATLGNFARLSEEIFWLDPVALYRVHEQTVRLLFEPIES
jgi:hypothetical protein